jgi:hypothetical protein
MVCSRGNQPRSSQSGVSVSTSASDPWAMARNCALSLLVSRVYPSAMLAGTETAARVI